MEADPVRAKSSLFYFSFLQELKGICIFSDYRLP
jgi:hypothetical protein